MKVSSLAAVVTLLVPGLAAACPMCTNQQPGGAVRVVALGVMLLLPFSIVFVVFRALRRAARLTIESAPAGRAATDRGASADAMRELSQ